LQNIKFSSLLGSRLIYSSKLSLRAQAWQPSILIINRIIAYHVPPPATTMSCGRKTVVCPQYFSVPNTSLTGACWIALKLGVGQLPSGTRFSQIAAVSVLGGIGFTMSIFIAELAFAGQDEYLLMAKTGVLAASLLAGLLGYAWLWWLAEKS
jgi:hypothetical protein